MNLIEKPKRVQIQFKANDSYSRSFTVYNKELEEVFQEVYKLFKEM